MERRALALWMVVTGLLVGVAGSFMFGNQWIGLSFPIFALICLGAVLLSARAGRVSLNRRNLWLVVPILFFAGMIGIRASEFIIMTNVLAATGLFLLLLHFITAREPLDTASLGELAGGASTAALRTLTDTPAELSDGWRHLRAGGLQQRQRLMAVLRGLLITLPVLLVFAALLAGADQIFQRYMDELIESLALDFDPLISRTIMALSLGWCAVGGLSYALARRTISRPPVNVAPAGSPVATGDPLAVADEAADTETGTDVALPAKRKNTLLQLTIIEATMLLGSVNLLFAAFVAIQFTYLFGGEANITAAGFTYSAYARRGFWELLTITVLTLGLGLMLDQVTVRRDARERNLFRGLAVVLAALMGVLIVSASRRMMLYEAVYGYTDDRVVSHLFIFWVGALYPALLAHLFRVRQNIFAFAVLLVAIGYTGHLNLLNLDYYIAAQNIARYDAGEPLDVCYLTFLSADATPVLLDLYRRVEDSDPALFNQLHSDLFYDHQALNRIQQHSPIFGYNIAREQARVQLAALEMTLESYTGCEVQETRLELR